MRILLTLAALLWTAPLLAETKTYDVKGMHCEACAQMISTKVCKLPGLDSCKVEMNKVVVSSSAAIDDKSIETALASAGEYTVTGVHAGEVTSEADTKPAPHKHHPKKKGTGK